MAKINKILLIFGLFVCIDANNFSTEIDKVIVQLKEAAFADFENLSPAFATAENYTFIFYPEFAQYNNESQLMDALKAKNAELFNSVNYQNQVLKNRISMMESGAGEFLEKVREKFMVLLLKGGGNPREDESKKIFVELINEYKQLCSRSKEALKEAFPNITHFLTENVEVKIFVQFLLHFLPFFESGEVSSFGQLCNLCPNKCPKTDFSLD